VSFEVFIVYVCRGLVACLSAGCRRPVSQGDAVLLLAGSPHLRNKFIVVSLQLLPHIFCAFHSMVCLVCDAWAACRSARCRRPVSQGNAALLLAGLTCTQVHGDKVLKDVLPAVSR
jgi:hypothetical protein